MDHIVRRVAKRPLQIDSNRRTNPGPLRGTSGDFCLGGCRADQALQALFNKVREAILESMGSSG